MGNHYATLGLRKGASEAEIKKAYKISAMRWHPDRNKGNEKAAQAKFVEVLRAKIILLGLGRDSEPGSSRSQSKRTGKPFDPFDKAGSAPREHSSGQGGWRNTSASNSSDFAYEESQRRERVKTAYSQYTDASKGRYDTYGGRSRSNTQQDHFRNYDEPSHSHRSPNARKPSSHYEEHQSYHEPCYADHRPRAQRTPHHEQQPQFCHEPSYTYQRGRAQRTPSYHTQEFPQEPSYTCYEPRNNSHQCPHAQRTRTPSYYPEPSYTYCEPRDNSYCPKWSPSIHQYSPDHGPPSPYRARSGSVSPQRFAYSEQTIFDGDQFYSCDEPSYGSDEDVHAQAMGELARAHLQAVRKAERWHRQQGTGLF